MTRCVDGSGLINGNYNGCFVRANLFAAKFMARGNCIANLKIDFSIDQWWSYYIISYC